MLPEAFVSCETYQSKSAWLLCTYLEACTHTGMASACAAAALPTINNLILFMLLVCITCENCSQQFSIITDHGDKQHTARQLLVCRMVSVHEPAVQFVACGGNKHCSFGSSYWPTRSRLLLVAIEPNCVAARSTVDCNNQIVYVAVGFHTVDGSAEALCKVMFSQYACTYYCMSGLSMLPFV